MLEAILKKLDKQEELIERMVRVETKVEENSARIGKR